MNVKLVFVLLQDLEQQFERERLSLEEEKTLLKQQLEELREELTSKLTAANQEVTPAVLKGSEALEENRTRFDRPDLLYR